MQSPRSVPTLIIGGFLGAGKTTLVNELLRQADGRRVVVFVNDFGAINIDHDLIETVEEDRIALSNGCVCCSLNDDLVRSMIAFCEQDRPELFAIEASGVADPKALSATLQSLQAAGQAHLQARIYLLDAAHFDELGYADTEDLVDHAAASDLILVNKADLVSTDRIHEIEQLLDVSATGVDRKVTAQARLAWAEILDAACKAGWEINNPASDYSSHADFAAVSFENVPPLSEGRLTELIDLMKQTCLRSKGFLQLDSWDQPIKRLQLVGRHVEMMSLPASEIQSPRLVVIGRSKSLPIDKLCRLLKAKPMT